RGGNTIQKSACVIPTCLNSSNKRLGSVVDYGQTLYHSDGPVVDRHYDDHDDDDDDDDDDVDDDDDDDDEDDDE
ncbi:jg27369, partial [Pararge aegeria aegeria]